MFLNSLHNSSSSLLCGCCFSFMQLLAVFILVFPCYGTRTTQASCNQLDRDSLLSIYNGVSTSSPLNWSVSIDCCSWEGVSCAYNGRVSRLWLTSRGLEGKISISITNLSHLRQLSLAHNQLSGHLPERLFLSLNRLEMIDLSYNSLSGQLLASGDHLPTSIKTVDLSSNNFEGIVHSLFLQAARNLISFNVSDNSFYGQLPSVICNFSASIILLDFSLNHFNGSIPFGFGTCSNLRVLRAGFNSIMGSLPGNFFDLSTLQEISFPGNKISGPLSNGIVNLTSLKVLELYANELTGPIPHEVGKLSNLEYLLLHMNYLNGTLPLSLMNCTRLTKLNLGVNSLSGELSGFDFSNFLRLRTIDLGTNLFNGSFPLSIASCPSLTAIRLSTNRLTGEIQPEIQSLQSLSFFSIANNSLTNITGAIRILSGCKNLGVLLLSTNFHHESLSNEGNLVGSDGFPNLMVLALGRCQLNGTIPIWLAKLGKLEVLDLSENAFTSSIPNWLGVLPNLFYLDLSNNLLSGQLSAQVLGLPRLVRKQMADEVHYSYIELSLFVKPYNLSSLQYNKLSSLPPAIYLNGNHLSGNIPVEIGQLKFIHNLDLSDNQLSGIIPDSISYLTNLERLNLSENQFSGEIPSALKNLHFLSSFSVANNNLQGPIPTGGQFDTFSDASFLGNPGLCGQPLGRPCTDLRKTAAALSPADKEILETKFIFWLTFGIGFGISFSVSFVTVGLSSRMFPPGSCCRRIFYQL
ncbi:tyrosine-sulfated glycopeptide receptor 1-like [Coffea arabica]|uniref:Tyrosine-sulfated glycopeptide receptor 1-like n=1 Tax=Coffea arabica TaxID=13443 RepID=A0ABM4UZR9_COFAR